MEQGHWVVAVVAAHQLTLQVMVQAVLQVHREEADEEVVAVAAVAHIVHQLITAVQEAVVVVVDRAELGMPEIQVVSTQGPLVILEAQVPLVLLVI